MSLGNGEPASCRRGNAAPRRGRDFPRLELVVRAGAAGWRSTIAKELLAALPAIGRRSVAAQKRDLRAILAESRRALAPQAVSALSNEVQARLIGSACFAAASGLVLYAAKDNEVLTDRLFASAVSSGRPVYFPRLDKFSGDLRLVQVQSQAELRPGAFGVLEPGDGEEVVPARLAGALICVPGLGFTPGGQRLGRGGGFYDRLLARSAGNAVSVGLAYSFQLLGWLPQAAHDARVDFVVTEHACHAAAAAKRQAAA